MNGRMPALAQESICQVWRQEQNGNMKGEVSPNGSTKCPSPPSPVSPLSTSPVPRIHRIPSALLLAHSSRSLSPSPPPEEPYPSIAAWFFGLGVSLARNTLFTLAYLMWSQILIGPTLWMSAWLWVFWKCISLPLTVIKWVLTLFQTWPGSGSRKRTVLISGGSTVQALHLARNFYSAGARVIVCEIEGHFGLARFSTAVNKFYSVPKPDDAHAVDYVNALCTIVEKENVSYYIPVSATNESFYDALAKPQLELLNCIVFCPSLKDVLFLDDLFEVLSKCRAVGLATPLYYSVTSREDIFRLYDSGLLRTARHFMANVGPLGVRQRIRIQVPPFRQDFRTSHEISNHKPWIIVQDLKGEHYVTCTTVKEAVVVGNVTCRVENDKGGLVPIEREEITAWIQTFFIKLKLRSVCGHFSFRFVISSATGAVVPLGCKVGVSLPYICFTSVHPRIVWKPCKHFSRQSSGPLVVDRPRYWMHDAVLSTLRHPSVEAVTKLIGTVLDKREALFVYWDPLPYCAYYHLQLPLGNIVGFVRRRNRQNRPPPQRSRAPLALPPEVSLEDISHSTAAFSGSSGEHTRRMSEKPNGYAAGQLVSTKRVASRKGSSSNVKALDGTPLKMADRRRTPLSHFMRPLAKSRETSGSGSSRGERERERERDRERESNLLRGAHSVPGPGCDEPEFLIRQNQDLRKRLEEESINYKRRLESYKQAQQHQAALVSRLQAKILQYKQRCTDLEGQLDTGRVDGDSPRIRGASALQLPPPTSIALDDSELDLGGAIRLLEEERRKCEKLKAANLRLKDQLEEAHRTNESLTNDLQKITNEWETLREELILKEDEWRDEEHAFNEYYTAEHSRLLMLWRDVVCVKRLFAEMQMNTERDLNRMKDDFASSWRDLLRATSGMKSSAVAHCEVTIEEHHALQREQENSELQKKLNALREENEALLQEGREKDERLQQLLRDLRVLEERCVEADQNAGQMARMHEDVELLQSALRDIAHAVIQDAESRDSEAAHHAPHVHLTPSVPVPPKSPKRGPLRTPSSPAFAESTISAVQAALHKYQLQIHELQVKLVTNKEQYASLKKQFDDAAEAQQNLTTKVTELTQQLDALKSESSQLSQEKLLLSKSLESARTEKSQLEKARLELSSMLDSLNADYDKLQKAHGRLQKVMDALEDDKLFLQTEVDRLAKDAEMRERNLRAEEDRSSRMREEMLTLREDLNKAYLEKEMLQTQKMEASAHVAHLEKAKSELELELEKVLLEKADLQDSLEKLDNVGCNLEDEKRRLQDDIKRLDMEKGHLANQCADQQSDLSSLRKELLQAEQLRLDLESERVSLQEKIKFLEVEKEKVEIELGSIARERNELRNELAGLSRKRDALTEETSRLRQRLEQAAETNQRINRNLEDLVKENEEKQLLLENVEKELQRAQEQLASLRSEKEALEAVLFDTQTNLEASDIRKAQLEKDNQELLIKQEALRSQIGRLTKDIEAVEKRARETKASLVQQMSAQENDYQQIIANLKKCNDDNMRKLSEEKEQMKMSLEKKLLNSVQQLGAEKDREIQQLQERAEALQQHIDNLCQQHEEVLLRAENEKQQSLMLAHQDQQALSDKLDCCQKELEEEKGALEKVRRDAATRAEQDRVAMNNLRDELARIKTRMEDLRVKAEEEKIRLEKQINETRAERDACQAESEELKMQMQILEDRNDSLQNQLQDTQRRLKETENLIESTRKELTDVRRQLADCNIEKEKYHSTNKELREHVKRTEAEKRETGRFLEEALQKVATLEDAKSNLEAEKARLQSHMREQERNLLQTTQRLNRVQEDLSRAQSTSSTLQNEDKERQARLSSEIEERERAQQELHQLKKQIAELDSSLEIARQEMLRLRSRSDEDENRWRHREQELIARLEDSRSKERKLEDQKHNLEICLADATQQIQELKARLGGTEGRVKALEQQLQQLEVAKKEAEQKLNSVGSTLRRIAGIQLDGSISLPFKLLSPSRRWSPARSDTSKPSSESHDHHHGHSHGHCHGDGRDPVVDVDPEIIRKGVRTLMQQVAQIERERDDLKTSLNQMKKQLSEASDIQNKSDEKLSQTLQNLRVLQEEKHSLEVKLAQKQAALQAQTEALQQKTLQTQEMREKITHLELAVHTCTEEKSQYEERMEKLRISISRLEGEKRSLQEELSRTESRATKLELHRMSLEGDLQRVQMMLQDKDSQIQKLQEKCETQSRNLTSLEERCASLKTTIDNLHATLERASGGESDLRAEIAALQKSLLEANASTACSNEKLKHLQKSLTNAENERRLLAERLEATQQTLTELRRNHQALQDQTQRLQTDLANNEVQRSGLEAQLRHATASWGGDAAQGLSGNQENELMRQLETVQREKIDLRGRLEALNEKVRQLESEKRGLERQVAKASVSRSKSFERPEKGSGSIGDGSLQAQLEQENRELRLNIRRLEAQLAEKEAELARLRSHQCSDVKTDRSGEIEKIRAAQLQAERLLEAREQSHRQQVLRLENQIQLLRDQLNQEVKRRQMYVLRSSRAGREMQQLRQALGDSLRTVSQDPALDSLLLEQEARKLDTTVTSTAPVLALPPPSLDYSSSHLGK